MANWIAVANVAECPPGESLERVVAGRIVAVFNVGGAFFALDGICPHQGGPLGKGTLQDCVVTCPWHGWQFDVRSGQHQLNTRVVQPHFAVRVEGEIIHVDMDESASPTAAPQ